MKKHVSILIPVGHTSLVNIVGTHQIFNQVNGFLTRQGREPIFEVELVGLSIPTNQTNGLFSVNPTRIISDIKKTDLIIIPAIHDEPRNIDESNKDFIPWLKKHYEAGAEIASLCVAAFFLASSGLLDGKQCSTHWVHADHFRKLYPQVQLVDDKIMTEDSGIYTSGGAYSFLNLLLYLIEKYAGREVAVLTAKTFMIDIEKDSQSPFIIFEGQKDHNDEPVKKAQEFIENNFEDKINVEQLASMFALSRRTLERRFKSATSNTISEYIQRVKMEVAKRSLESSTKNVNEVMFDVGYNDTKAFRSTFKKVTGLSPVAYKKKFNNLVEV
ncbi:GlxA family transcriptional regulator [Planktosalinus lacus]|uniref:AraC family transcriptional regulator n=1 Tax=Planktosalinus lacus TaxID=1526573 RepID=A0A8J2Y9A5_9FLAO|nr:helix-turn-helix domain-containing protein [Planktosalinus lacus]GGD85755.1 AraC family transcriptional regulator [Planktosalinus lacus]